MAIATPLVALLRITHPLLLAPMDIVSDARLTAEVSAAGGLGILGGGYGNEEWLVRQLDLLAESRARFGVGFITWSMAKNSKLLDMALERKPVAIMLSFGNQRPFIERIKRSGAKVMCQIQSVAMARDAAASGADVIVAQGGEAGGHGISRGLIALIPEVVDAVGDRIPVVAAGGIADGRGVAAALVLGAAGVLIGTRFYASTEAAAEAAAKNRICSASGDDTMRSIVFDISRRNVWPQPFTGRCLVNRHLERWHGREVELLRHPEEIANYEAARASEDFDVAAVIAGESTGLIHDIMPARRIVEDIMARAEALLTRGSAR